MKMDEHLQALLDYTIFHIGVYLTMGAAIIAADFIWHKHAGILKYVLALLVLAGAAGGTVASNIPTADGNATITSFLDDFPTIFFHWKIPIKNGILTQVEHGSFWIALGILLCWFFYWQMRGKSPFDEGTR